MRTLSVVVGCVGLLFPVVLSAADPPYVGRWRVNEDKTDYGPAFNFSPADSGALRFTQGDQSYLVRFDGKEYPHPLGGLVRWIRIDDRSWETTLTQNGKVIGNAIYQLSDDGQTLTTRPKRGPGETVVHRRTSGERQGLVGAWSVKTASVSIVELAVAGGYDLVFSSGPAQCKANFDGQDHPTFVNGKPTGWSTCMIMKAGDRGFSFTVNINGKPFAVDTYTVSEDGQTLTQIGGLVGQPPNHTVVHEREPQR
ncbi:MAG TPA: hypothetical protein VFD69_02640 [Vicinamibacterales bacterium]|nr:hypothetical protein [Vicinamibacterales bacterium]